MHCCSATLYCGPTASLDPVRSRIPQTSKPAPWLRHPTRLSSPAHHVVRASDDNASESSTNEPSTAPKVRSTPPPGRAMPSSQGPNPQGLRLERVERLNDDVWAGVAAVDRGQAPTSFARAAVLAAGDSAAFLLFATIGRVSHHEALSLGGSFETALPFLLGWFAVAPFTGGFSKEAQGGDVGGALGAAAKSWALATPLAIAVRSLSKGYIPDKAFIIVSFAATAVLLLGWRAAATKMVPDGGAKQRANKKGNPLEFIGLLFSLVKRW